MRRRMRVEDKAGRGGVLGQGLDFHVAFAILLTQLGDHLLHVSDVSVQIVAVPREQ